MNIARGSTIAVTLWVVMQLLMMQSVSAKTPDNFVYTSSGQLKAASAILERSDIAGAQIVYNRRLLEPEKGKYHFTQIENDLARVNGVKKKLFIQIQDRFFEPGDRSVPDYLLKESSYGGGLVKQFDNLGEGKPIAHGWMTQQWNPAVRQRYQALLAALAEQFDGRVYGINL
ncbi:MAG: hypothetical protein ACRC5A_12235, partial [Enterobacteriaceae bacterium]